jgi:hypothetical protein
MLVGQGTPVQDENPSDVWTVNAGDVPNTHTTIPRGDTAITDMDAHNNKEVINGTPVPDKQAGGVEPLQISDEPLQISDEYSVSRYWWLSWPCSW